MRFEILNERSEGMIQLANQPMLLQLPFLVRVPAGAVDEVEIVGNFHKTHA